MDEESDMTEQLLFSLSQVLEDHLERWERGDRKKSRVLSTLFLLSPQAACFAQ